MQHQKEVLEILNQAKYSYLTKHEYDNIKRIMRSNLKPFVKAVNNSSAKSVKYIVTAKQLSQLLKSNINHDLAIIRKTNSKHSTDKLAYADWFKVPATDSYREIFHYQHHLMPEDKHIIRMASKRVKLDRNTYKLDPDMDINAPVYQIPDKIRLWDYSLIFIKPVIKQLKTM